MGAGSYKFDASFAGDANYNLAVSGDEPLSINKATITLNTTIYNAADNSVVTGALPLGSSVYDTAGFTGAIAGFTPAISQVSYTFTSPSGTAGAGSGARSTTEGPLGAGSYKFDASFAGDANYNLAVSGDEPLSINKATITLNTTIYNAANNSVVTGALPLGSSVYDTASFTGAIAGFTPAISQVSYTFTSPSGTAGAGSGAQSTTEGPLGAGSYKFDASFAGDANYNLAVSGDEPLSINKATITLNTTIYNAANNSVVTGALPLGSSVYDTASFTGAIAGFTPAISQVSYTFTSPSGTAGAGSGARSTTEGPLGAGSYKFDASFAGDANYNLAVSGDEPLSINKATITLNTTIYNAANNSVVTGALPLGSSVYDTASFTGAIAGFTPAISQVSYTFTSPSGTAGAGSGAQSTTEGPLGAGSYKFDASFAGDANYNLAVSGDEPLSINKATITLNTTIYNAANNSVVTGALPSGSSVYDTASFTGSIAGFTPAISQVSYTFTSPSGTAGAGSGAQSTTEGPLGAGSYKFDASFAGDANYNLAVSGDEPLSITGTPNIGVTKTADHATITAGQTAGFVVTITNNGTAAATGLTLSDPLPAGAGSDVTWTIDATDNTGNFVPGDFTITGTKPNQNLTLASTFNGTLAVGQTIAVHITGVTTVNDATTSTNPALNVSGLATYTVLYEGTGNNQLSISNDVIDGNIGVGGGKVAFSGPGTIGGRLDFAAANTGQYQSTNGSNVGPTSVNYNVSAVTTAITAANSLSTAIGGLPGTSISFNNANQTVNESSGSLQTSNGVTYRVFNVTSYSENNADTVTINGDGSGDPVVFNFAYNSNTNLGGQVALTGGLTNDQVMWNFTSSNKQVQLNNNGGTFVGVILLPNDQYQSDSSNLDGRVYGGAAGNMQIVSGANVYVPPMTGTLPNTATVGATGDTGKPGEQASATITINSPSQVTTQSIPSITTTPNTTVVPMGTATNLKDTALLSGGANPTGTITFTLYAPNGTTVLDSEQVTVSGNGSYTTPNGYNLPTSASSGVYQWDAVYVSNNGNNTGASDNNDPAERVTVVNACCNLTGVTFSDTHNGVTTSGLTNLRGNTQQGDTVTATFTVPAGDYDQLSLVSYNAPEPFFDANLASDQTVYQYVTQVFGPGTHTLTVTLPNNYYQVDFVCGTVIATLGPAGSNNFYSAQNRLNSADNGGVNPAGSAVAAGQFGTIGFWGNNNGQAVINSFNGGSSQTQLGNWLATNFPALFGAPNPYTSATLAQYHATSFAGLTNAQIATVYSNLGSPSGVTKNTYVQAFCTALGIYADTTSLGGNATGAKYGFVASAAGGAPATWNLGSTGATFGMANNSSLSVLAILQVVNENFTASTGTFFGGSQSSTSDANTALNGINNKGDV